jgi:hypothetical protein
VNARLAGGVQHNCKVNDARSKGGRLLELQNRRRGCAGTEGCDAKKTNAARNARRETDLERFVPSTACPAIASVAASRLYATRCEPPKESVSSCSRELTGENSPLYAHQPTKKKTDRVLVK